MSCSPQQIEDLCNTLNDHTAMTVLIERMSLTYWHEFRNGDDDGKWNAALKQDMLEDFLGEIQAVLAVKKLENEGRESNK